MSINNATAGERRHSMYLNDTMLAAKRRAKATGRAFPAELERRINRYERITYLCLPDVPADELREFRRLMVNVSDMPPAFMMPKILASFVETSAEPDAQGEEALRLTYALARRIARMSPAECLALVEVTERWVRDGSSEQSQALSDSLE